MSDRGRYVHDLRQRCSYELRPDEQLDARLRAIAHDLEADGLLEPGASTAPRFHPHLTLLRASTAVPSAVERVAKLTPGAVAFRSAETFGDGRIVHLVPDDVAALEHVRAELFAQLDPETLDPVSVRRVWTPHVTLAYAVPDATQEDVLARVRSLLPIEGRWAQAQSWDLDVRPTELLHATPIT